jgi:hydrogenase maturation protease
VTRVRIIGVGTPHGDDRVGLAVVAQLSLAPPPHCELLTCERPGSELIDLLAGAPAVLIVDAMRSGGTPGTIHDLPLSELPAPVMACSSHGIGICEGVALAGALGRLPPGRLIGIEAERDGSRTDADMSPAVAAALTAALARLDVWVRHFAPPSTTQAGRCA